MREDRGQERTGAKGDEPDPQRVWNERHRTRRRGVTDREEQRRDQDRDRGTERSEQARLQVAAKQQLLPDGGPDGYHREKNDLPSQRSGLEELLKRIGVGRLPKEPLAQHVERGA